MTYIYLNIYKGGYLYVGSHTWSGEGLDPSYMGSSSVASRYGWIPVKIKLLEIVSDIRKFVAEREWIEKYAKQYGIADCVFSQNEWTSQYKRGGRVLNGHANTALQMNSKESRAKSLATRLSSDKCKDASRRVQKYLVELGVSYSERAEQKRLATLSKNGTDCYSREVSERRKATKKLNKETNPTYRKQKIVRATVGDRVIEGVLHRVCVELGHPTWDTTIVQKFKKSNIVLHREVKFEWLNGPLAQRSVAFGS